MKRVKKPVFFIIAALILALTYTSVFGVYTQNGDTKNTWIKGAGDIRWGIDIRGGVEATFSPADGVEATAEQLEAAKAIIELRMVSKSITDYEIYTDEANDKIIVRFPWKSGESDFDPEKAIHTRPRLWTARATRFTRHRRALRPIQLFWKAAT